MSQYEMEQQQLARRRKMIEALMMGRQQPGGGPGGQPTTGQAIAQALGAILGAYQNKQLDTQEKDLSTRAAADQQARLAQALSQYDSLSKGSPGVMPLTPNDDEGNPMPSSPATPPDPRGANMALLKSGIPMLQEFGTKAMLQQPKAKERKYHVVGGALVPEPDDPAQAAKPVYTTPEKPEKEPEAIRTLKAQMKLAGIDPESPEAAALFRGAVTKSTTHQPATTVSVNTDKGYAGAVAEGLAKQDVGIIDAGRSAPDRIASAKRIKEALNKNPITGTGAEARLGLNKMLATAGFIDGDRVKSTENLAAELASGTLDAIKSSGLGSGQGFTDKDRQFLEKARSGNIEVNPETLRYLADLNERAGAASIKRANEVIRKLKGNKNMGGVGTSLDEIAAPGTVLRFDKDGNEL
jgi:hypothetical protein